MRIVNIHQRIINQPKTHVAALLATLASPDDQFWPHEKWPPMRLSNGLTVQSAGGHGPIGYTVTKYQPGTFIEFRFSKPRDFHGIHTFELIALSTDSTKLTHTIEMDLPIKGVLLWYAAIKWLHDALLEDCLDKVANRFSGGRRTTTWNAWVRLLRKLLSRSSVPGNRRAP